MSNEGKLDSIEKDAATALLMASATIISQQTARIAELEAQLEAVGAGLKESAKQIAIKIAKNCGTAPQLVFPHLYLGLKELFDVPKTLEAMPMQPLQQSASAQLTHDQIRGILKFGYPTYEEKRLIRLGWNAALEGEQSLKQGAPVRVPLTFAEISKWWFGENGLEDCDMSVQLDFLKVVRAVEAKHGITRKNEGAQP